MAKFHRNNRGIGYLTLTLQELEEYSKSYNLVCDTCLSQLTEETEIMLIPILNEAYCSYCGKQKLDDIVDYPEDREIRRRREQFYKNFYDLEEDEVNVCQHG